MNQSVSLSPFCFFWLTFVLILAASCGVQPTEDALRMRGMDWDKRDTVWLDSFALATWLPSDYSAKLHRDPLSYAPDPEHPEHTSRRLIRCNVHFTYDSLGTGNFDIDEVGVNSWQLVEFINEHLSKNYPMDLPIGNATPAFDIPFRLVKHKQRQWEGDKGGYAHLDQELYFYVAYGKDRNNYSREVINKYAVGLDSILNIFLMPHHPDSVASPTYTPRNVGIALGNALKVSGLQNAGGMWTGKGILVHEIGHVLGLSHSWHRDGCDDTPEHPNCWEPNSGSRCGEVTSNNVMDYNSRQNAWSPCQIGKVMKNIQTLGHRKRRLVVPTWCEKDDKAHIRITDTVEWRGDRDLDGDLTIDSAGVLKVYCRLSLPKDASILIRKGGTLVLDQAHLHNSCGDQWNGIQIERSGFGEGTCIVIPGTRVENAIHGQLYDTTIEE